MALSDLVSSWTLKLRANTSDFDTSKVVDEFRDVARAADQMADTQRRAWRESKREARTAADGMREAGKEAGDEFAQNLAEGVASGDFSDLAMSTVGGLISTLKGPAAAALAGFGVAAALAWANFKKEAEDAAERVDRFMAKLDSANAVLTERENREMALAELGDNDRERWRELTRLAHDVGVSASTYLDYISGVTPETQEQRDAFARIAGHVGETQQAAVGVRGQMVDVSTSAGKAADKASELASKLAVARSDAYGIQRALDRIPGTKTVTVKLRYADGTTRNKQLPLDM